MIQTEPPTVELPKDVGTLQQIIVQLLADVDDLNKQLAWCKRYVFGRRSEKVDQSQLILFEGLVAEAEESAKEISQLIPSNWKALRESPETAGASSNT